MLRGPFSSATDEQGDNAAVATIGKHGRLLACVVSAFPQLDVTSSRIEERGGDHDLLIINEQHAFRFPRRAAHNLELEVAVLECLRGRTGLLIPSYDFVDPNGHFAGYRFIEGAELTPTRFAALSEARQDDLLGKAARFLSDLHELPTDCVEWPRTWPSAWRAANDASLALVKHLPVVRQRLPQIADAVEQFWQQYRRDQPPFATIIHGDFVPEHLLLNPGYGRLVGIIDFGDVALGDPAQDFLGFWMFGAAAAFRAAEHYPRAQWDPGLLTRSRNHFIRYRLDRLSEDLRAGGHVDVVEQAAEIEQLLHDLQPIEPPR